MYEGPIGEERSPKHIAAVKIPNGNVQVGKEMQLDWFFASWLESIGV